MRSLVSRLLNRSSLGLWPVRVRKGLLAGARWTIYPWTSYWRGGYEPHLQAAILSLGGGNIQGWNCWDLGAHFGFYSVSLARRVGPSGQVAAFEPNPQSFARLARHKRMNHLEWLKLYPSAVSDRSGSADLLTYGDLNATTTHLAYEGETLSGQTGALSVPIVRLDDLVDRRELRPPQLVKIDVEGHGHKALRGMAHTLESFRPTIIVGFHSSQEVAGVLELLDPLGYERTEIQPYSGSGDKEIGRDFLFRAPSK